MIKASEKASKILIRDFGEIEKLQVSKKGPLDFVTNSDLKVEKIIIDELKKAKPNYSIISEENGIEKNRILKYKKGSSLAKKSSKSGFNFTQAGFWQQEIKKIDERAIFDGSNSSSNSKSASAAGSSLEMQGWTWDFEPNPNDNSSESGRIIFEIIVDYYGEIVGLKTLETTLSPMVENIYREEILKLTFSPTNNNNPAEISKGKITFIINSSSLA